MVQNILENGGCVEEGPGEGEVPSCYPLNHDFGGGGGGELAAVLADVGSESVLSD